MNREFKDWETIGSSRKLASIQFRMAMVVALNDAAYTEFNVLRLGLSLRVRHDNWC